MTNRNWEQLAIAEIDAQIAARPFEIVVGVHARRAGTARRRLRHIAALLNTHGYSLHVVDPQRDHSDGRWSTARFRNPVHAGPDDQSSGNTGPRPGVS